MKRGVMLAICAIFLVMLSSGCAPQEVPIDNVPEPMVEEAPQEDQPVEEIKEELIIKEDSVIEEKDDLSFDLPPDEDDSAGWTQTLGPLGGTVIRMISHAGTIWASLYSGGIYELQTDSSWKQIAVGYGIPEVRAFDIVTDSKNVNIAYVPEMIAGIAKTTNKGVSWQGLRDHVTRDIEADIFHSHTLALDPENPKILYV